MNKIIRERYPVSLLPEDLRTEVGTAQYVRLVIEDADARTPPSRETLRKLLEESRRLAPIGDDPVARIRHLRDEWDD